MVGSKPIADSALLSAKIVKNATLKIYKGAAHGMCTTRKDEINKDLLEFNKGLKQVDRLRTGMMRSGEKA